MSDNRRRLFGVFCLVAAGLIVAHAIDFDRSSPRTVAADRAGKAIAQGAAQNVPPTPPPSF